MSLNYYKTIMKEYVGSKPLITEEVYGSIYDMKKQIQEKYSD